MTATKTPEHAITVPKRDRSYGWMIAIIVALVAAGVGAIVFLAAGGSDPPSEAEALQDLVAAEKAALDPYFGQSDPTEYVALLADDATYYDPATGGILTGQAAKDYLMASAGAIPAFTYEILNEKVALDGDLATFTFNVSVIDPASGAVVTDWNVTEINRFVDNDWEVTHAHWAVDGGVAPVAPPTEEVAELLQSYKAAWNEIDSDAFLAAISSDYQIQTPRFGILDGPTQALYLGLPGFHTETIGEPYMVGVGPWYVAEVSLITADGFPEGGVQSINIFKIVEEDGALKIQRHFPYSNQFD